MKTFFSYDSLIYLSRFFSRAVLGVVLGLVLLLCSSVPSQSLAEEEQQVSIRHKVVVEGSVIKLEEIFTNIGHSRYKNRIILESPPPGEQTVLPANWLARLAESYRIAWKPLTRFDEVKIIRRSRLVREEELKHSISNNINIKTNNSYDYIVELDDGSKELHLPSDMLGNLILSRLDYAEQNGRFTALIETSDLEKNRDIPIRGFAHRIVQLPVLSRSMSRGEIIKFEDISYKKVRWNKVPRDAIVHADDLKGMALRSRSQGDSVLRKSQIEQPVLVRNKNLILVELLTNRMSVKLRAQAMEDGHMGEVIRVRNLKSKKVFEAEVIGLKKARVIMDGSDVAYLP